ncbi:isopenicillin N synthase family dioxygenase [Pseudofrankia inefficax]|uniref:2OG-Fe(II) oxygenase n=1 Tax=Pseudofrankia inefficax (strain DSM 45817 / CECT 9037 / DDB 130130 / EuI1c) TaxID=298654 RepID=E3J4Y0_PSEI1|nr:2OG-Fe(II) oxygenase family protein [Pseudofrankia inefficax]ADP79431.1 2OG-Fe(II) oxygenase [Pseudofrankia inefficax]
MTLAATTAGPAARNDAATRPRPDGGIPVIDLGPFLAGADPTPVVERIAQVCSSVSFLQVVGHGIAPEAFDAVYRANDALLALPDAEKAQLGSPDGHPWRGLSTMRSPEGSPLVHRFQVCNYEDAATALAAGVPSRYGDYFARNVWPEQVEGLRASVLRCLAEMKRVGDALMELFARALGLPPEHFAPMLTHPVSDLAVNTYPAQPARDSTEPSLTFREHTDSGMLTVLHQRGDYAGLQVQGLDDAWVTVPIDPAALVINIGDLMSRWTNDRWPSTRHRVVAAADTTSTRASIATFHLPNVDTVIAPLEPFVGPDGPHYEPVTPYVWEAMFLARYRAPDPDNR